jgi:mannose-6-phosphate isomerase class I
VLKRESNYDKRPTVPISPDASPCLIGWEDILARLAAGLGKQRFVLCVECYPGVFVDQIAALLRDRLRPSLLVVSDDCLRSPQEIERMLACHLTDDPIFGVMKGIEIRDLLDSGRVHEARRLTAAVSDGLVVFVGTGASLMAERWDLLVYANMARWEIQQRQRGNGIGNLGAGNRHDSPASKYKRAFFVDWRAADRLKQGLYGQIDFLLDTNDRQLPKMISGDVFRRALEMIVRRPFRVVPFFDPGPWGGQWMKKKFDLPQEAPNYAWCFDCVPEENSILLGFGARRVEIPAIDAVFRHPVELLGQQVFARFGAEFPIRFDFLDTMDGGNLSLQVHPLAAYIREHFGMAYTQDESYYLLDADADACVYLGLREGVDCRAMAADLREAENARASFAADRYVNAWPARKHDHFLIPAGTIHCSGRNSLVLEISATPYIFTFKLWDWGRLGLDDEPRPTHIEHGLNNIQWQRTTDWVRRELINRIGALAAGNGWREEHTGLHETEFIETRRHWFTAPVVHRAKGSLNVLNLVEGDEALVESPWGRFDPFVVHYAETFIVPAAAGDYTIRPAVNGGRPHATIKAYIRDGR